MMLDGHLPSAMDPVGWIVNRGDYAPESRQLVSKRYTGGRVLRTKENMVTRSVVERTGSSVG